MWLYIVIAIVLILFLLLFKIYNSLIKLDNRVKEAFSTMDVYLKKRWDLIPNIVEIVKGYAKHENETLKGVIQLRNNAYDKMSNDEKIKANQKLTKSLTKIMALVETYPNLKADKNFQDLSNQLIRVEDEIANSRKYYNGTVREYNNKVQMFPSNIVAIIFSYKTKEMFEIKEEERQNVKVSL